MASEDRTVASNPGRIRVQPLRFVASNPVTALLPVITLAVAAYGAFAWGNWLLMVLPVLSTPYCALAFRIKKQKFEQGDVNVSKILSSDPPLFAVATDMQTSHGGDRHPAVKIVHGRVPAVPGIEWKAGDFFATASLYRGDVDHDRWDDFFPEPLSCATADADALRAHDARLVGDRPMLDLRLSMVPRPYEPGLYWLDEEELERLEAAGGESATR